MQIVTQAPQDTALDALRLVLSAEQTSINPVILSMLRILSGKLFKTPLLLLALLFVSACASQVPVLIKLPPVPDPEFQQVKNNITPFLNQYVRWGGKIISIENKENSSWIEILVNPLNSYGRPGANDNYKGRFIAKIDGFLDPEHYAKDRKLTVYGKVESSLTRKIDDHPYNYPLVNAKVYYLWPEYRNARYQYPYYPAYHSWPYYRYHHSLYHRHHLGLHYYH